MPQAEVLSLPMADDSADDTSPHPSGERTRTPGEKGRRKRPSKPMDFGRLETLRQRYVLIYGTDTVFDELRREIVKVGPLRLVWGADYVKAWLGEDSTRRMVGPEDVVFDPTCSTQPPAVNLFDGFAMQPVKGDCQPMLELLHHLCGACGSDEEVAQAMAWVLRWLALPLQQPGTKMRTALVFHGPQGSGKNLFFEGVGQLYGRYHVVVGQDQLEDKFNDWASQKLLVIGDEVVARAELYHQKNKLKSFVTGETIQINAKMLPLRTEKNHANVVFLSNEQQPLALETGDRRYMVVYTPPAADPELYARVGTWLDEGGAAKFYRYLLDLDLGGFHAHTKPLMTRAKADLIDLGLKPAERFLREWLAAYISLPLWSCENAQLYRAFLRWCRDVGERFPPRQAEFTKSIQKAGDGRLELRPVKLDRETHGKSHARMWVVGETGPQDGATWGHWAGECMDAFEGALRDFMGDTHAG